MSLIHLFAFAVLLSLEAAASFSPGSRSILRDIGGGNADQKDYAVELNFTNFDSVLHDTPARYAVVEFFAHWCPACRNYRPQYEKVAKLFNGAEAIHPGIILMARVDCALKINNKLCDKFSVSHYPMLFWGPPAKFVSGSRDSKQEKSEISVIDDGRTAERLLNWINKQIGSSYGLDDQKFENEHLRSNISDSEQISQAVYDIEEATAEAFDIILAHKTIKTSETDASFIKFLQLLAAHHPSRRCRKGSAEILVNFDDLCPSGACSYENNQETGAKDSLGNFRICGKDVPRGYYMFCRGSKNDTRGFSCGLWVLMHSLSVRIEDGESQFAFTAICDFIHNFFMCEDCRRHFYDMCTSVKTPFKKSRDFVLWLWSTHNKVNERLMKEEASLETADPKFPKLVWPTKQLCPTCYLSTGQKNIDWDHDEVYKFMKSYYGQSLMSLYKEKGLIRSEVEVEATTTASEDMAIPTNAVVVPIGAALAIALASCAFGALACYWRTQQKNRKPRRSWN
ncbi:PREDICTED: sulfhydryl oxidase 2 isoform X2 [Tarenaya hassleriana]|uniref:sulfhydryl oxidase 2 isoform X2 n=1 Tax=Tarenaya hassleriana TaxID=28532 RepID=UPI00053C09DD|nr:PREDICTED: sulfhydryl oxidase 2 isoform X2 [Tarenaya hassleriana]